MWNTTLGNKTRQTMKFVLKQYDTELLSFDLRSEGVDGFVCTILKKIGETAPFVPAGAHPD